MDRRLRIDVVEGERMLVLIDLAAGHLAAQDAGEDVAVVIGLVASIGIGFLRSRAS